MESRGVRNSNRALPTFWQTMLGWTLQMSFILSQDSNEHTGKSQ